MGTFSQAITVSDREERQSLRLDAQVDPGAAYLVLSENVLRGLGVRPTAKRRSRLADGRRVEFSVTSVLPNLDGETNPVLCIFAPEGSTPLLGAVLLETFGLADDPVSKRRVPVERLLPTVAF